MKQIKDGDLIKPVMAPKPYAMQCCDCGLVHNLFFTVNTKDGPADPREYELELRVYRDEPKTLAARGGVADWWLGPKVFRELRDAREKRNKARR